MKIRILVLDLIIIVKQKFFKYLLKMTADKHKIKGMKKEIKLIHLSDLHLGSAYTEIKMLKDY